MSPTQHSEVSSPAAATWTQLAPSVLHALTDRVIADIRAHGISSLFEALGGYHEFQKSRLKPGMIEVYLKDLGVTEDDVQIEFAVVPKDLSHQVHLHELAYALATPLGAAEGLDDPRDAYVYLSNAGEQWRPLAAGQRLDVPPGIKHGFALKPGGVCYFLTIQSPPTDRRDADDYAPCKGPAFDACAPTR